MSQQPDLSTLPKRMRYAADVIAEAINRAAAGDTNKPPLQVAFTPNNLRRIASEWETEDREADEREVLVQRLAYILEDANVRGDYEHYARQLIESGWRKAEPDG